MRSNERSQPDVPDRGGRGMQGKGKPIRKQVDDLLRKLQPTPLADERRRIVFEYVQDIVQKELPSCKIFPVGSFPLKTYLPCADVDMVMFIPQTTPSDIMRDGSLGEGELGPGSPGDEGGRTREVGVAEATRTPALVSVNQALCMVAAQTGCRRGSTPQNRAWLHDDENVKPEIRNVSFINARTPIVTMVVGNVVVDVTENQGGSVAASALLEEADILIQQDHLFKRSLLLLKAWAWCETPRLVGQRVLGAQKGGLTSYGLSVMVLHLFSLRSSADNLLHPVDVFIRFFEVYSEFDWGRHCLTLDGPVAFEEIREYRPCPSGPNGTAQGEGSARSRLRPLVHKVLAHLSPALDKEKTVRVRGRPTGRFGRKSDGQDGAPLPVPVPAASGGAGIPAVAHFPLRDCNIQDPLNALNNLGHSVSKSSFKALENALQQGRQQLETFRLLPASPATFLPHSDGARRRPRESEVTETVRLKEVLAGGGGNETVGGGVEVSSSPVDYRARSSGATLDLQPQAAAPQGAAPQLAAPQLAAPQGAAPQMERVNSSPPVPNHVVPPMQFVRIPQMQAAHPSVMFGQPRPVLLRDGHQSAHQSATTREGQQVLLAFPQPFLQAAAPQRYQFMHQHQQQLSYVMPQGSSGGMLRPNPTVLVPAAPMHPEFLRQWNMQRAAQGGFQPEPQFVPDQRNFSRVDVLPQERGDQVAVRPRNHVNGMEVEARPVSAHRPEEGHEQRSVNQGMRQNGAVEATREPSGGAGVGAGAGGGTAAAASSGAGSGSRGAVENGNCRPARRKHAEEGHPREQGMKDSILPWDLLAFVNSSPTSSTASMSDYAEEGSKDDQDCQLLYESGVDDEARAVPAKEEEEVCKSSGHGGSANGDSTTGDRRQPKRAGGAGAGMKRARKASTSGSSSTDRQTGGNLWGNWFLREFFADSCQLYASGDGFREDLLDHPCQRSSKLQERGSPPPRPSDSRDMLGGASREMWGALETVGEMMRGADSQAMADKMEASTGNVGAAAATTESGEVDELGQGAGSGGDGGSRVGSEAGLETRLAQVRLADVAFPAAARGRGVGEGARPKHNAGEMGNGDRSQPRLLGVDERPLIVRPQVAVDDETGYTTSEEQGDKEDGSPSVSHGCVTFAAPSPPIPLSDPCSANPRGEACASPATAGPGPPQSFSVCAATQTQDTLAAPYIPKVTVDKEVQYIPEALDKATQWAGSPLPTMVSRAVQFEGVVGKRASKGVQCALQTEAEGVPQDTQCRPDTAASVSAGVECLPRIAEDAGETPPAVKLRRGAATRQGAPGPSERQHERCNGSDTLPNSALPPPSGARHTNPASAAAAAAAVEPSSKAGVVDHGEGAPKSKKKRKKPKPGGAGATRTTAAVDGFQPPPPPDFSLSSLNPVHGWRVRIGWFWGAAFFGVVGVVLAGSWATDWGRVGASIEGRDIPSTPGDQRVRGERERAQPPVWVVAGSSITLGDVAESQRGAQRAEGVGRVQWVKDGVILVGQTRLFLSIPVASLGDEGTYACFAVEDFSRVDRKPLWQEATVRVSEPPLVESQLQTQRLARGEMLAIVATASGVPQPEYQWRRNGVPIPGATRPMFVRHSVTEADMGTYTCDVYNVAGRVQWEEMAVILREDAGTRDGKKQPSRR